MGGKGPKAMSIKWLTKTRDECKVEIRYDYDKPKFVHYDKTYPGGDAGPGFYKSTICVRKSGKSIMIEEETDFEIGYNIGISNGLNPNELRFRGWSATAPQYGTEATGKVYRNEAERGYPMDATMTIENGMSSWLSLWQPAGGEINTGRYWQIYNRNSSDNSNLFGIFHGNPAKMIGAGNYGVSLRNVDDKKTGKKNPELLVWLDRRGPDNSWYPKKRFEWGVFISTKKDLLSPEKIQPINIEMNKESGLGLKVDQYAEKPLKPIKNFNLGALFCSSDKMQTLIAKVKSDENFYKFLMNSESYYRPLFDAWRNQDSARSLIKSLINYYKTLKENYKTGEGVYRENTRYWKGAYNFKLNATIVSCLLADKSINISSSNEESLLELVKMMGRILWDDANVPFFENSGVNYGPANMSFQYANGRYFFALLFADDPEFSSRAKEVLKEVKKNINDAIYKSGASLGTPHYTQATIEPILFTLLQLRQAGVADLFKTEPLLKKFADFYQSLLTPPSPRFMGYHKLISFGDGTEESAVAFALLASGFESINPELSNRLYYLYENGAPRMSLFGPTFLAADLTRKHESKPTFSSSNYFGYLSHLRSSTNTTNESAVWVLNGDSLFDHRNDDAGEIAVYALKAPLSVSRSSFYYPQATDARIRSVVIPLSMFPEWDKDNQPINIRSLKPRTWEKSTQIEFAKFPGSSYSSSRMTTGNSDWYRKLILISGESDKPIIVLYDSVGNNEPNIWSMLFMSDGPVKTPAGDITPEKRIHNNNNLKQLPTATPTRELKTGLNRFTFTGQNWNKKFHETGGIDWDVYTYTPSASSFSLAQWTTTWENSQEAAEFQASNGRAYEEGQQILRWKSKTPFLTVILPTEKGRPYKNELKELSDGVFLLENGDDSLVISKTGYWKNAEQSTITTSWSKQKFEYAKTSIAGGPAEVELKKSSVVVRVHGNSGKRTIYVPTRSVSAMTAYKNVKVKRLVNRSEITIDYKNDKINLLSDEKGYTEFVLKFSPAKPN